MLDTDASGFAIGGIISQKQSGTDRVIAYGSKTLNQAQQNYCTTKRELYSIVYFTQYFKHYLLGREFILRTDHAPLVWLCKKFKNPSGLWARWISILGQFTFIIQYRPGPRHGNAERVSRRPKRPCQYPDCEECSSQENHEQFFIIDTENHEQFSQNDTENHEQFSKIDTENHAQFSQNHKENHELFSKVDTENHEQFSQNDRKIMSNFLIMTQKIMSNFLRLTQKNMSNFLKMTQKVMSNFLRLTQKIMSNFLRLTKKVMSNFLKLTQKIMII